MAAYFLSQLPTLSDGGLMGYYNIVTEDPNETNQSMKGKILGNWYAPGRSLVDVKALLEPMEKTIVSSNWGDPIFIGNTTAMLPSMSKQLTTTAPGAVGIDARIGSRLLNRAALETDHDTLVTAFKTSTTASNQIIGHVVAGPGVKSPPAGIARGSDSVLPAWREAYTHKGSLGEAVAFLNGTAMLSETDELRDIAVPALNNISPGSGAYRNEVDPTEPDWQSTFYGSNYPRLLQIKQQVDPNGVFWCKACVGSELWNAWAVDGVDNGANAGVGQSQVMLCRV